jgi:MSHA biogenesis protein MshO
MGAGAAASLMADDIAACAFSYAPGSSDRAGLLSLELGIGAAGETANLMSQVHVDNVP